MYKYAHNCTIYKNTVLEDEPRFNYTTINERSFKKFKLLKSSKI